MRKDVLYSKLPLFHYLSDATSYGVLCKLKQELEGFKVVFCLAQKILTTFIPVFFALFFFHLELLPFKLESISVKVYTSKLDFFQCVGCIL